MTLYLYDHCPFCAKARMICGLKSLPVEPVFLLEDDVQTPTALVGSKTTPILRKADGSHMAESMDIVHYLDGRDGQPLVAPVAQGSAIQRWHEAAWMPILKLSIPRLAEADLPEFASAQARAAFKTRQTRNFGEFEVLLADSAQLLQTLQEPLRQLDALLAGREQIDADDFLLYPTLRMLSIVAGVDYPANVAGYMQRMAAASGVALHLDQAR